jgi:ABC-type phosphate/phosphonate transport system substrate-binding protein
MAGAWPAASLPMYDWPEVRWATDLLWNAIAQRLAAEGIHAPATLDRSRPPENVWSDPRLVLSQTCGFPLSTRFLRSVQLVATPVYDVRGCVGPLYSSMIIARDRDGIGSLADIEGRRVAYNACDSLSGYVVLGPALRDAGVGNERVKWLETGSHRASVLAVAEGKADAAAIDAVCWALAERHEPGPASKLKVIAETPLRPGLPFITALTRSAEEVDRIRTALAETIADPETRRARDALYLIGIESIGASEYEPLAELGRALS